MASSVLLDTNILMELFFERSNVQATVEAISALSIDVTLCTSILSVGTLFYYVEKQSMHKESAHIFLADYEVLAMNQDDYAWAAANDAGDFEDALQTACARRHDCSHLLTLDQNFKALYGKYLNIVTVN